VARGGAWRGDGGCRQLRAIGVRRRGGKAGKYGAGGAAEQDGAPVGAKKERRGAHDDRVLVAARHRDRAGEDGADRAWAGWRTDSKEAWRSRAVARTGGGR